MTWHVQGDGIKGKRTGHIRRQNPYTNTETDCIITETEWEFS